MPMNDSHAAGATLGKHHPATTNIKPIYRLTRRVYHPWRWTTAPEPASMFTSTRIGRYILWNRPTSHDHNRFPGLPLAPASKARPLPDHPTPVRFGPVTLRGPAGPETTDLVPLLERTGTSALLVLSRGAVAFEWYGNGGGRHTPGRCFSVTKSFASALLGIAIAEGALGGLDATLADCLPELQNDPKGALSLRHLMEMRSGIRFVAGPLPWSDDAICYFSPDCRAAARRAPVTDPVGAFFHYNDYHLFLVGMMLERATGMPVQDFFARRLWQRIGAEYPASLTIDSRRCGFVHLESGLNATARDLAKFGQLYLQKGQWDGAQIVSADWVRDTTSPEGARRDPDWFRFYKDKPWGRVFASGRVFYKRFWWGHEVGPDDCDFFAMGALGQHIYVSPRHDTVIVRLSDRFPKGMWWPPVFRQLAEQASSAG